MEQVEQDITAAREADWQKLVKELPQIVELFTEQPHLAGPFRSMFDSAWILGSRAGLAMAEEIVRGHRL